MRPNGQQPHILCIDQAPEVLALMRDLLEDEGFRVSTLTTVERSLDAVVALAPDLIILDSMWTSSDNEWTFLNLLRLHRRTRPIPVILCTGAVERAQELAPHLATLGVRVVFKPFTIDVLVVAAHAALGRAPIVVPPELPRA